MQFASSRAYVSCPPYAELERLLGAMFDAPLVVAQTTTLAHFAALPILIGREDAVICDQLVHNSVQSVLPTLAAAGTLCRFVRHNRVDRLDEMVRTLAERHRRVWYLADGVYSMHGDTAPLDAAARAGVAARPAVALHRRRPRRELGREARARHRARRRPAPAAHGDGGVAGQGVLGGRRGACVFPDAETARLVRTCGSTLIFSGPLQPALLGAAIASARVHLSQRDRTSASGA